MHLKSSCSFLIHMENKVWSVSVDIRSPTFSMWFRHNDNDHMSFMTRNQKWFHLELVFFFLKTYSHTIHSVILCIIISGNCRWQPSVNTNTHNGVKFPSQIIETIFNALNATIYSTTLLHETKYQSELSAALYLTFMTMIWLRIWRWISGFLHCIFGFCCCHRMTKKYSFQRISDSTFMLMPPE